MSTLAGVQQRHSSFTTKWITEHLVVSYYVLTLALTSLVALPLIAVKQGWLDAPIPFALHYLAACGPMLAALIVSTSCDGRAGLRELGARILRWRVGWLGWLGAFAPVLLFAAAALGVVATGGAWPDLTRLGEVNYLPDLGAWVLVLWFLTFGLGEEIGWRGLALHRLQERHSPLRATLFVWLMWAAWHLPYFFYLDTYLKMGLGMFLPFAFGILAGAVVLTWVYNVSRGSILMVAIWHATFDLLSAAKISEGPIAMYMSIGVMVWAVALVVRSRRLGLESAQASALSG